MLRNRGLWFGPVALLLLSVGTFAIGLITPGYSHVRQTVSELGEIGSPGRGAFAVLLCLVAACLTVVASSLARILRESGHTALPAYFVGAMGVSAAGVGIFAFPNPLHNVFGMSELVGYQAPLVTALVYRSNHRARRIVAFSLTMYITILLAVAANLVTVDRQGYLWSYVQPYYGVVQRFLFISWFVWCAGFAVLLMRSPSPNVSVRNGMGDIDR